jgi:DUF4097 and DUF4098 domain-containing protein YvlB
MNERERVLDLVKKGVLSTEEALDLLEGMAKAKDENQINKAAAEVSADKTNNDFLKKLMKPMRKRKHLLMVKKNFVRRKHKTKKTLRRSWMSWQQKQIKLLLN